MPKADAKYTLRSKDATESGLRSAETRLQRFRQRLVGAFASIGPRLVAPLAAVTATIAGWIVTVRKTADELDDLRKRASEFGVTAERLAELDLFAEFLGVDPGRMLRHMEGLRDAAVQAADGIKTQRDAFRALGIDAKAFLELDAVEQLRDVAIGLQGMGQARGIATRRDIGLGGRGAGRLVADPRAIEQAAIRAEAAEPGRGADRIGAAAEEMNDNVAELGAQVRQMRNEVMEPGIRTVSDAAQVASDALQIIRDTEGAEAARERRASAEGVRQLTRSVNALNTTIGAISNPFGLVGGLVGGAAASRYQDD